MGNIPGMNATAPKIEPDTDGLRWLKHVHPRAATRNAEERAAQQAALVCLTGDTARCFWTMNGQKMSQAEPFKTGLGQRVRIKFISETTIGRLMHLHGVFMELINGNGIHAPRKRTVIVPTAQCEDENATFERPVFVRSRPVPSMSR